MTSAKMATATACYVDDENDWLEEVSDYLMEKEGDKYFDLITLSSINNEFKDFLAGRSGPVILIIDLRFGQGNFAGYDWLLNDVRPFVEKNPDTVVMVLSGQLDEQIEKKLWSLGIPTKNIFNKKSWAEDRGKFFEVLKDTAEIMNAKPSVKKLDPYLSNQVWKLYGQGQMSPESEYVPDVEFSMLVSFKDPDVDTSVIPGLKVLGKVGNVFSCTGNVETLKYLENDPNVENIEASRSSAPPEAEPADCIDGTSYVRQSTEELGDEVIIGIIDSGINVLQETFQNAAGETRILAVWDQTDPQGPPPVIEGKEAPFGTEYTKDDINEFLKGRTVPAGLGPLIRNQHGTQVASIAAGTPTAKCQGGVAPNAKIIAVNISDNSNRNNYTGNLIPALQYLRDKARKENLPLVINLSQGINAGGHDGSSLAEASVDSVTENGHAEGIVVVKSAGNERNKKAHSSIRMVANMTENLQWETSWGPFNVAYPKEDVIELWFDPGDDFIFFLQSPTDKAVSERVSRVNPYAAGEFSGGHRYLLNFTPLRRENGSGHLLIETYSRFSREYPVLEWTLHIISNAVTEGEIHAWVERAGPGRAAFCNHIDENFTLTVPGTARHIISVGATETTTPPLKIPPYSSCGPTRDKREKPEVSAPGERILAATCGGSYRAGSGTSMAAPHVSGALGLLLSYWQKKKHQMPNWSQLTTSQIRSALIHSTERAKWHEGLGHGMINVEKLIESVNYLTAGVSKKPPSPT